MAVGVLASPLLLDAPAGAGLLGVLAAGLFAVGALAGLLGAGAFASVDAGASGALGFLDG